MPRSVSPSRSTLGARVAGRRAGQRFDADRGITTEALIFLGDLDPEAIGPGIAHATHYEPTPVGDLERLLAHVPWPLEGATFVDFGSGMGRALVLAAAHPFRAIVGIEFSRALHEVAKENLARLDRSMLRCKDLRLVRADVLRARLPRGPLVAYLFNPFDEVRAAQLADRLAAHDDSVAVLYHTPAARAAFDDRPAFALRAESSLGNVYLRQ